MDEKNHEEAKKKLSYSADDGLESGDVLERIIHAVGDMGVYQRWMVAAMMPFIIFLTYSYGIQMFITATPQQHWCRVPALEHLDIELRRNLSIPGAALGGDWDRCAMYDANWTEVLQTMTPPTAANSIPCSHGWEFLYDDIPYKTIVSEREWVCENAGNAPFAQSVYFVGSFIGCALFGWMGDHYGRLPTLLGANLAGFIGSIMSIFTSGVWDFAISRFIVGMSNDCSYTMIYILVLEYVGPSHRTWVSNISAGVFACIGALSLVGLALWLLDWQLMLWATSLPMLIVVATPWLLPESVRWLTSKGKVDKAVANLRRFERINKKKIPDELIDEFVTLSNQTSSEDESLKAVLASPRLRKMLAVVVASSMAVAVSIDAILRMSESIGTNFFLTFTLSTFTDIPSLGLVTLILDKFGRRSLIIVTLTGAGMVSIWCAFVSKGALQTALAVAIRFLFNMAGAVVMQVTAELLPTGARASGYSLVHLAAFIAMAFSPYIVFSGRLWSPLPLLIVGTLTIFSGIMMLFLPETKGKPMPQTIVEAEKLARDGMLWQRKPVAKKLPDVEYATVDTKLR